MIEYFLFKRIHSIFIVLWLENSVYVFSYILEFTGFFIVDWDIFSVACGLEEKLHSLVIGNSSSICKTFLLSLYLSHLHSYVYTVHPISLAQIEMYSYLLYLGDFVYFSSHFSSSCFARAVNQPWILLTVMS